MSPSRPSWRVFLAKHIRHSASKAAFQQRRRQDRSSGAHGLAEFYSTFGGFPNKSSAESNDVRLSTPGTCFRLINPSFLDVRRLS
jgi:hypothetical protein